jgi:hypothetical protein
MIFPSITLVFSGYVTAAIFSSSIDLLSSAYHRSAPLVCPAMMLFTQVYSRYSSLQHNPILTSQTVPQLLHLLLVINKSLQEVCIDPKRRMPTKTALTPPEDFP